MKTTFAVAALMATLAAAGIVEAPKKEVKKVESKSKKIESKDLDYDDLSLSKGSIGAYQGYDDFYAGGTASLGYGSSLRSDVGANIRPDKLDKLGDAAEFSNAAGFGVGLGVGGVAGRLGAAGVAGRLGGYGVGGYGYDGAIGSSRTGFGAGIGFGEQYLANDYGSGIGGQVGIDSRMYGTLGARTQQIGYGGQVRFGDRNLQSYGTVGATSRLGGYAGGAMHGYGKVGISMGEQGLTTRLGSFEQQGIDY